VQEEIIWVQKAKAISTVYGEGNFFLHRCFPYAPLNFKMPILPSSIKWQRRRICGCCVIVLFCYIFA